MGEPISTEARALWHPDNVIDERDDEEYWFDADDTCPHCGGDGMDPACDYMLPCPLCQGEQRP